MNAGSLAKIDGSDASSKGRSGRIESCGGGYNYDTLY